MSERGSPLNFIVTSPKAVAQSLNDVVLSSDIEELTDFLVSDPSTENRVTTRKIARPEFIWENSRDPIAKIKLTLMHQRRGNKLAAQQVSWEDADSFPLNDLKAGQQVRMKLDSGETKRLFQALIQFYQRAGTLEQVMEEAGVRGTTDLEALVLSGQQAGVFKKIAESAGGERVWELLEEIEPGLQKTLSIRKQHEEREAALNEFRDEMEKGNWDESDWQNFFEWNHWIFGYGLSYQFLNKFENQPHYGGTEVGGGGAERGDFLLTTEAAVKFTVLVEIKKPDTPLQHARPYRQYYRISAEVAGGIAQLHANCERWQVEGSRQLETQRRLFATNTHVHGPKGILVVGHTDQLNELAKAGSFQRFRRSLANPEIVTFDELLARAEHLVRTDFDISNPLTPNAPEYDDPDMPF